MSSTMVLYIRAKLICSFLIIVLYSIVTANFLSIPGIDGIPIENGSSTSSTFVNLSYTGMDNVGVDHFICSIDEDPASICGDTYLKVGLDEGIHTFQFAAVNMSNNIDPSPARFSWEVIPASPASQLDSLRDLKNYIFDAIDLPNGDKSGLIARLNAAITYLTDSKC